MTARRLRRVVLGVALYLIGLIWWFGMLALTVWLSSFCHGAKLAALPLVIVVVSTPVICAVFTEGSGLIFETLGTAQSAVHTAEDADSAR